VSRDPADVGRLYRAFIRAVAEHGPEDHPWRAGLTVAERDFLEEHLRLPDVLVAGCGFGRGIEVLKENGAHVVGVDREPAMIAATRKRFPGPSPQLEVLEIEALPRRFGEQVFDTVVALGLVTGGLFLPGEDPLRALDALRRVLRADGVLLLDFLDTPGDHGRTEMFTSPLERHRSVQGCCARPTRVEVLQVLARAGFRSRLFPLLYSPGEPLTAAVCRPDPPPMRRTVSG
jgi:SAM-dependent methyltransferase